MGSMGTMYRMDLMDGMDGRKLLGVTPQRRIARRLFLLVAIASVIVFVVRNLAPRVIGFGGDPLATHFAKCEMWRCDAVLPLDAGKSRRLLPSL